MRVDATYIRSGNLDRATAWLRLGMILISGVSILSQAGLSQALVQLWLGAVAYSSVILVSGCPKSLSPSLWWMATGTIDWALISAAVVLDGGLASDFYVLYVVLAFGTSVRFGMREAILCGASTAVSYCLIVLAIAEPGATVFPLVALRMGYLMAISVGSGLLAREADRVTRADVSHQAEQIAVRDVAAALSHELINPLAAASGLVEILFDPATGGLSAQQRTLLCGIDGNVEHAHALVRNVVAAERIERGQHGFHASLGDLNTCVQKVVNDFSRLAEARGVGLVVHLTSGLPVVPFDGTLLEHALRNVLGNALEFTPADGAVRVSTAHDAGDLAVEVWNSGGSLSTKVARNPFAKFARDRSRGIGLGLYVAKCIAELHGGKIAACNAADGVTVTLRLPCPKQEPHLLAASDEAWDLDSDAALAN